MKRDRLIIYKKQILLVGGLWLSLSGSPFLRADAFAATPTPTPAPYIPPETMCPAGVTAPMSASSSPGGTNQDLFKCIYDCQKPASLDCTGNQKKEFNIFDKNGVLITGYYGLDGHRGPQGACLTAAAASADCPIKVTSEFEATCPNGTATCRKAASILISYKIEQDPNVPLQKGVPFRAAVFSNQPYMLSAERLFAARNTNFTCPSGMKVLGIDNYGSPTCGTDSVDAKVSCLQEMLTLTCGNTTTQCSPAYTKPPCPTPTPPPPPATPAPTPTPPGGTPPPATPPPATPPPATPAPTAPPSAPPSGSTPLCSDVVCSFPTNKFYFESATGMGSYAGANNYSGPTLCGFNNNPASMYVACGQYPPPSSPPSPQTSPPQPGYVQCAAPTSRPLNAPYWGVVGMSPCGIP